MKKIFTTHQAASLCETTVPTIQRWVDDGKIKSYSTPGGHRRILRNDLFDFMESHNMPIPKSELSDTTKVLIVDDDAEFRKSIVDMLNSEYLDFDVAVAIDGFDAGMMVWQFMPDILLLDLIMPNIDGFEVCKKIKGEALMRGVKILVVTAYDDSDMIKRAYKCGADKVLIKPIVLKDLLKDINTLVG